MATYPYSSIDAFQKATDAANAANEVRYSQGLGLWDQIVQQYAPGGSFGQGAMASYQQGKNQSLASSAQGLVSSGLYNSSTTAGLGARYEQNVGSTFRANLADQQAQAETQALQGKAGFIERRTDKAPDASLFANLQKGASNTAGSQGGIPFANDMGKDPFASATTPKYASGASTGGFSPNAGLDQSQTQTQTPQDMAATDPMYDYNFANYANTALGLEDPLSYTDGGSSSVAGLQAGVGQWDGSGVNTNSVMYGSGDNYTQNNNTNYKPLDDYYTDLGFDF